MPVARPSPPLAGEQITLLISWPRIIQRCRLRRNGTWRPKKRRALNVEISLSRQWRHPSQTRLRGLYKLEAKIEEGGEEVTGAAIGGTFACTYPILLSQSLVPSARTAKQAKCTGRRCEAGMEKGGGGARCMEPCRKKPGTAAETAWNTTLPARSWAAGIGVWRSESLPCSAAEPVSWGSTRKDWTQCRGSDLVLSSN
jgi:hypothetical protein